VETRNTYLFKVCFLGEGKVGKTSLVSRFVYDSFSQDYLKTLGTNIHVKHVQVKNLTVKLVIWDIAGQQGFRNLRRAYYQNAAGAFFVFDTTKPETLDTIDDWLNVLYEVNSKIPVILIENKIDLPSNTNPENVKKVVEKYDLEYVRASAKNAIGVEEAFQKLVERILEKVRQKSLL